MHDGRAAMYRLPLVVSAIWLGALALYGVGYFGRVGAGSRAFARCRRWTSCSSPSQPSARSPCCGPSGAAAGARRAARRRDGRAERERAGGRRDGCQPARGCRQPGAGTRRSGSRTPRPVSRRSWAPPWPGSGARRPSSPAGSRRRCWTRCASSTTACASGPASSRRRSRPSARRWPAGSTRTPSGSRAPSRRRRKNLGYGARGAGRADRRRFCRERRPLRPRRRRAARLARRAGSTPSPSAPRTPWRRPPPNWPPRKRTRQRDLDEGFAPPQDIAARIARHRSRIVEGEVAAADRGGCATRWPRPSRTVAAHPPASADELAALLGEAAEERVRPERVALRTPSRAWRRWRSKRAQTARPDRPHLAAEPADGRRPRPTPPPPASPLPELPFAALPRVTRPRGARLDGRHPRARGRVAWRGPAHGRRGGRLPTPTSPR